MNKIIFKNARIIDPSQGVDEVLDLLVEGEFVSDLGKNLDSQDAEIIDCTGKILTPGWVDMHVHVREPGREDKENIETFSRAAVMGGVTSACAMPNTNPPADNQTVIKHVVSRCKEVGLMNIHPFGCITKSQAGCELTEMVDMKNSGMVGVSDDGFDVNDMGLFKSALKYCKTYEIPVVCHNEDCDLSRHGVMHEGEVSTRLGLEGIPASSESVSIAGQIILAEEVDYPVHFTHVSARSSLEMIRFAKERGIKVTADVTPHHLVLNHEACCGYDTAAKVNPPLRSEDDRRNLIEALRSGVIDCIATDHAPHTLLDKWVDFKSAAFGISGIETFVALCVTKLIHEEKFSWSDLVAKVTCNPAKIMRLDRGNLAKGSVADIVLIDENLEKEVSTKHFLSKGKNSPFDGYKLRAWPVLTMVSGKIRMRDFEIFAD